MPFPGGEVAVHIGRVGISRDELSFRIDEMATHPKKPAFPRKQPTQSHLHLAFPPAKASFDLRRRHFVRGRQLFRGVAETISPGSSISSYEDPIGAAEVALLLRKVRFTGAFEQLRGDVA